MDKNRKRIEPFKFVQIKSSTFDRKNNPKKHCPDYWISVFSQNLRRTFSIKGDRGFGVQRQEKKKFNTFLFSFYLFVFYNFYLFIFCYYIYFIYLFIFIFIFYFYFLFYFYKKIFKGDLKNKFWNMKFFDDLVIATPDVIIEDIRKEDLFVVIACDGLWDVMSSQEVVDFIQNKIKKSDHFLTPEELVDQLVQEAINLGSLDNISIIIIFLKEFSHIKNALTFLKNKNPILRVHSKKLKKGSFTIFKTEDKNLNSL